MSNELNLDQLEALAKAATPGPWVSYQTFACNGAPGGKDVATVDEGKPIISEDEYPCDADADFIAGANPATVRELIAMARRAPAAVVDAEGLPPLPRGQRVYGEPKEVFYTAEQVRQAQRDAIAADRAQRQAEQQAHVMPPTRGTAGQHDAGASE
jgi:hypothetical protein